MKLSKYNKILLGYKISYIRVAILARPLSKIARCRAFDFVLENCKFKFEFLRWKNQRNIEVFKIYKGGRLLVKIENSDFFETENLISIFEKSLKIEK